MCRKWKLQPSRELIRRGQIRLHFRQPSVQTGSSYCLPLPSASARPYRAYGHQSPRGFVASAELVLLVVALEVVPLYTPSSVQPKLVRVQPNLTVLPSSYCLRGATQCLGSLSSRLEQSEEPKGLISPIWDLDAGMRRWWISSGNHCATLHLAIDTIIPTELLPLHENRRTKEALAEKLP